MQESGGGQIRAKMKKFTFLLALAIVCAGIRAVSAQSFQEIVYLKNGSMIRGTIIEQVPNESLKIQTADGSVFVYKMSEVEKITKELINSRSDGYSPRNGYAASLTFKKDGGPQKGYRDFVELGYTIGTGLFGSDRVEFSTTHGYQFIPYFYAGIGTGVHYYHDASAVRIPIYADLRVDFMKRPVCPFIDLKIGYTVYEDRGFYLNPMAGVRFSIGRRNALNVGLGYTMQRIEYSYEDLYGIYSDSVNIGGFSIRLGFEF